MKQATVILSEHPIEDVNEKVLSVDVDQTLKQLVEDHSYFPFSAVYVNDEPVEEMEWDSFHVEENHVVLITPSPGIIGAILTALGSYIAANWPAMVMALAMAYLGGVIFNSQLPEQEDKEGRANKQSYGWNPRTSRTEGIPRPFSIGLNMHYGNIVSQWTDVDEVSGSELLYIKLALGEGPTTGIETGMVYLNGQPVGNFPSVSVVEAPGTFTQSAMAGFEQDKIELSTQKEVTNSGGSYTVNLPHSGFDDIEWTLQFRGLYYYNDMGDQLGNSVTVRVEIADVAIPGWTTIFNDAISGNEINSIYHAYSANDASGFTVDRTKQYKLRVTKISTDRNDARYGDTLMLRSVRGVVDIAFSHPGVVLTGIKALGTELLNSSLDIQVLHRDRILLYYNGTSWVLDENRNRAWAVYNMLVQPVIKGTGESGDPWVVDAYEGFQPSQIDTAFFYTWAEWCDTQVPDGNGGLEDAYPLDHIYDSVKELWGVCVAAASIGRAHLYWQGTTLTGWLDTEADNVGDLICYDNILENTWRQEWVAQSTLAGTCIVTLQDANMGYKNVPWPTHNANAGPHTRTVSIDGVGVKTRAFGSRIGEFALERNALIREIIQFTMFKDALLYEVGGVYPVQHKQPNWGASYRTVIAAAATATSITLDRTITNSATDTLYIRSYDSGTGEVSTKSYTVDSITDTVVTLTSGITVASAVGDLVAIGSSTEIKLRRLIGKDTLPNHMFDMVMETYDVDLFDVDALTPTIPYPDYTPAQTQNKLIQQTTEWDVRDIIGRSLPPQAAVDIPWISNISWEVDSSGDVVWSATDAAKPLMFKIFGTTYDITADSYTPASGEDPLFFYWNPSFTTSYRVTTVASEALASGNWMVATYKSGTIYPSTPIQLLHAAVILAGTIRADQYAELRQTMPWTYWGDLDSSNDLNVEFKIPSETTSLVGCKLSFRIRPFRATATGNTEKEQTLSTTSDGGSGTWDTTGAANWSLTPGTGGMKSATDTAGFDGYTDLFDTGHTHDTVPHSHGMSSTPDTDSEDGVDSPTDYAQATDGVTERVNGDPASSNHTHDIDEPNYSGHRHTLSHTSHDHGIPTSGWTTTSEEPDTYGENGSNANHKHQMANHVHAMGDHTHNIDSVSTNLDHDHGLTLPDHDHDITIPAHNHGIVYGIYEEDNSPVTIHYHIDNGAGPGVPSPNYTGDETDIEIVSDLSGTGWKTITFSSDKRCRLTVAIEVKVDVTA